MVSDFSQDSLNLNFINGIYCWGIYIDVEPVALRVYLSIWGRKSNKSQVSTVYLQIQCHTVGLFEHYALQSAYCIVHSMQCREREANKPVTAWGCRGRDMWSIAILNSYLTSIKVMPSRSGMEEKVHSALILKHLLAFEPVCLLRLRRTTTSPQHPTFYVSLVLLFSHDGTYPHHEI